MALVAAIAILCWLVVAAEQIRREPNSQTLCHLRRYSDTGKLFAYGHGSTGWIFWSKYWRKVLGLRWPGNFVCPCKEEFERESGRKTVDLATSNDMNEIHDLMAATRSEDSRTIKRGKIGDVPTGR